MRWPRWLRRRTPEVDEVRQVREQLAQVLCEGRRIVDEINQDMEGQRNT